MDTVPILIEKYFFQKLVNSELFSDPRPGVLDRMKERVPTGTAEQFDRAAEIIIRERKSGAFPSFPDCEGAIKRALKDVPSRSLQASRHSGPGLGRLMTKSEYFEAIKDRKVFEIIKRKNEQQWTEWRNYWNAIGCHGHAKEMDRPERHEFQAPAEYPANFDRHWDKVAQDVIAIAERQKERQNRVAPKEVRAALLKEMRAIMANMKGPKRTMPEATIKEQRPMTWEETEAKLLAEKNRDMRLSDEALISMGVNPHKREAA